MKDFFLDDFAMEIWILTTWPAIKEGEKRETDHPESQPSLMLEVKEEVWEEERKLELEWNLVNYCVNWFMVNHNPVFSNTILNPIITWESVHGTLKEICVNSA